MASCPGVICSRNAAPAQRYPRVFSLIRGGYLAQPCALSWCSLAQHYGPCGARLQLRSITQPSPECACREVRKQTCDLITLLEMAEPLSHYYLFMEDDFRCATAEGAHGWVPWLFKSRLC